MMHPAHVHSGGASPLGTAYRYELATITCISCHATRPCELPCRLSVATLTSYAILSPRTHPCIHACSSNSPPFHSIMASFTRSKPRPLRAALPTSPKSAARRHTTAPAPACSDRDAPILVPNDSPGTVRSGDKAQRASAPVAMAEREAESRLMMQALSPATCCALSRLSIECTRLSSMPIPCANLARAAFECPTPMSTCPLQSINAPFIVAMDRSLALPAAFGAHTEPAAFDVVGRL
jgi:hypothetical protein